MSVIKYTMVLLLRRGLACMCRFLPGGLRGRAERGDHRRAGGGPGREPERGDRAAGGGSGAEVQDREAGGAEVEGRPVGGAEDQAVHLLEAGGRAVLPVVELAGALAAALGFLLRGVVREPGLGEGGGRGRRDGRGAHGRRADRGEDLRRGQDRSLGDDRDRGCAGNRRGSHSRDGDGHWRNRRVRGLSDDGDRIHALGRGYGFKNRARGFLRPDNGDAQDTWDNSPLALILPADLFLQFLLNQARGQPDGGGDRCGPLEDLPMRLRGNHRGFLNDGHFECFGVRHLHASDPFFGNEVPHIDDRPDIQDLRGLPELKDLPGPRMLSAGRRGLSGTWSPGSISGRRGEVPHVDLRPNIQHLRGFPELEGRSRILALSAGWGGLLGRGFLGGRGSLSGSWGPGLAGGRGNPNADNLREEVIRESARWARELREKRTAGGRGDGPPLGWGREGTTRGGCRKVLLAQSISGGLYTACTGTVKGHF